MLQFTQNYDFIVSTVVPIVLEADRRSSAICKSIPIQGAYSLFVPWIQKITLPNVLLVHLLKKEELAEYYKDWELVKYNENPGHLHRRDENGNRIQLRFATMLAKKKIRN